MTSRGVIIKGLSKSKYFKPKLLPFYPGNLPLNKITSAYQLLDAKSSSPAIGMKLHCLIVFSRIPYSEISKIPQELSATKKIDGT